MNFNLTISKKLAAMSLVGLFFLLVVGATGYFSTQRLVGSAAQMASVGAALKSQMEADQAHDALRADVLAALLAAESDEKVIKAELEVHARQFTDSMKSLDSMPLDPPIRAAADKVKPALTAYVASARSVVETAFTDHEAASARLPEFMKAFKSLETEMSALSDLIEGKSKATEADSTAIADVARYTILGVIVVSMAVMLLVGTLTSRSIVVPIRRAVDISECVAAGDLTSVVEVQGVGETAQLLGALKRMNRSLATVVGTVRESSDSIATGSSQISTGNQDLSQRTEEQASNLQQTAASMEELTATVRNNASTTREAAELAQTASNAATQGGVAVNELIGTMAGIAKASQKINDIIGAIDGIAFQTNILALNAAVEAARAGEQGRGFAVVATEVRTLAQRSALAAKEIKALIETSVAQVGTGSRQAIEAGNTMKSVVAQVKRVTVLIGEVNDATNEQTAGIGQISDSVTQLDQVTQQNAALVEEAAAASENLKHQARQLVEAVATFRLA